LDDKSDMHLSFLCPALLLLSGIGSSLAAKTTPKTKVPKDAILLSQVKTLTLRSNAKTSHRRVPAVPQLTCTGPACKHHQIDVLRCTNAGPGYNTEDIEWSCTANLPKEFKLGSTDVACEGYASKDDEFVLKGSCGVEYRLLYTDAGEERYGNKGWWSSSPTKEKSLNDDEGSTIGSWLFMLAFVGVLAWIVYSAYRAAPAGRARGPGRAGGGWGNGWGGGGGGGGDDGWDPPPPYPGKRTAYGAQQQEGWRPGFWTGALGGAAAGYAAGRRGQRQQEPVIPQRGGGWFGGGGSGSSNYFAAPTRSGSSSSSSARHESTGFGSTSRR